MSNEDKKTFGVGDMVQLLSVDASMPTASSGYLRASSSKRRERDVAMMNAAEAAAYLSEKRETRQIGKQHRKRLRVNNKQMDYQKLLEEQKIVSTGVESMNQYHIKQDSYRHSNPKELSSHRVEKEKLLSSSSDDETSRRGRPRIAASVIISKNLTSEEPNTLNRTSVGSKLRSDSSSSDSDSSSGSSSPSCSLTSKQRRKHSSKVIHYHDASLPLPETETKESLHSATSKQLSSSDASVSSKTDSDDESNSDSSVSAFIVSPPIQCTRPVYIPKHKRALISEHERLENARHQLEQEQKKQTLELKKSQSKAMVAHAVECAKHEDAIKAAYDNMGVLEEEDLLAGMNGKLPPDDNDEPESEVQDQLWYLDWQVRECLRVLHIKDELAIKQKDQDAMRQRRKQTDKECQSREQPAVAPGSDRKPDQGNYMQRYYHKGAFFNPEEEDLEENDVRKRATEYARAATGQDRIDYKALPKVMQVKAFGKARHSTRYKGLNKEDTTDRSFDIHPLTESRKGI